MFNVFLYTVIQFCILNSFSVSERAAGLERRAYITSTAGQETLK